MLGTSSRRRFLVASTALVCHAAVSTKADELPKSQIRATDGDPKEPDWKRRLTIRVGVKDADLNGTNEKVIQAACDYVTRMGGGTVQILPGVYTFRNSVYLPSNIRIVGSGPETILTKG
ncbi:MAG: hypothetical protein ABGX07_12385, partial [Pirellulaceae bacterium]